MGSVYDSGHYRKAGRVEWVDLINNISLEERVDETTGVVDNVVIDWHSGANSASLKPGIMLKDERAIRSCSTTARKSAIICRSAPF